MVNNWGREGTPGAASGSRKGPLLVASLLALVVGTGAGYGFARLTAPAPLPQAPAEKPQAPSTDGPGDGSLYKLYAEAQKQREEAMREASALRVETVELKSRIAALETALEAAKDEPDMPVADNSQKEAALRREIEKREVEISSLRQQLADIQATVQRNSRQREQALKDNGALKLQLSELTGRVTDLETRNQDMALHAQDTKQQLDAAVRALKASKAETADAETELTAARSEISALRSQLAEAEAARPPAGEQPSTPADPEASKPAAAAPRDAAAVTGAMARAPGLKSLSYADRQVLAQKLEEGACVTDALEAIFDRVPVLTLRSLIRDLDSPC